MTWKERIDAEADRAATRRRIDAILRDYGVPLLDAPAAAARTENRR